MTGAILAGAKKDQIKYLEDYGLYLGRAFQVKDDCLGIFEEEAKTGKSSTTDLEENKKTLLLWHAYRNAGVTDKKKIKAILGKEKITRSELEQMRKIMIHTGSLEYAKKSIKHMLDKALSSIEKCAIKKDYKTTLTQYSHAIVKI